MRVWQGTPTPGTISNKQPCQNRSDAPANRGIGGEEEITQVFNALDVDQSGVLTEQEFMNGTKMFFGEELTMEDAMELYKKIDINNDGTIQFNEFVLVTLHKDELHSQQKLQTVFEMMDKNGDNTISADEL
ncbi:MAG: EF-hand domain-containing protein, partial [Promethearchaeia archaeon]